MSDEPEVLEPETLESEAVVPQPTVESVIADMKTASLADIKRLPEIRKAQAVPFVLPGTDMKLMIAKCDAITKYKATIGQLKLASLETDDEKEATLRGMNNAIIKSSVVDPELDDEALETLNKYNADAFEALLGKCVEVSTDGRVTETDLTESFSSGNPAITN